ncbi:hypothetical protein D1AOALGA4SA_10769 [Olavius algarvensis Delta 1 endosymbiont]|nr:hypothetical protein D1AOALGA4SA_10769 [Olavius algarvensis Delta 1 endosymbiont]
MILLFTPDVFENKVRLIGFQRIKFNPKAPVVASGNMPIESKFFGSAGQFKGY